MYSTGQVARMFNVTMNGVKYWIEKYPQVAEKTVFTVHGKIVRKYITDPNIILSMRNGAVFVEGSDQS